MNFYKRVCILSVAFICALSFVACSDDDDDDSSSGTSDTMVIATGEYAGHAYVDMGLSVMWATCNLGGDIASDYGDYYMWGETISGRKCTADSSITYKMDIDDIAGDATYDAATAEWGSSWRLPTKEEFDELVSECSWKWTMVDSIYGYYVTADNGNSIFFAAAGACTDDQIVYRSSSARRGYYWSSTPDPDDTKNAYYLYFYSGHYYTRSYYRYNGRFIRPVY